MAGGGGGAVSTDPFNKGTLSRVLYGYDQTADQHYDWEGASYTEGKAAWNHTKPYSLAPGALRFVFERGISDKGGNPYQGVNAYNPDTDLTTLGTKVGAFDTAVTALDPSAQWDAAVDDAVVLGKVAMPEFQTATILTSAVESAVARVVGQLTTVMSTAQSTTQTLQSDTATAAKTQTGSAITAAGVAADTLTPMVTAAVQNAITTAMAAISASSVTAAVDAYRQRALAPHLRSINRFTGGMADINAVQSSAFVFGLAMLEGDFNLGIADFQAKLELELYNQGMQQFTEVYRNAFTLYMDTYKSAISLNTEGFLKLADMHVQDLRNAISSEIQSTVQMKIADKGVQADFITAQTREVLQMVMQKIDAQKVVALMHQDSAKLRMVAKSEEYEKNLEIDVKDTLWDLDLFQTLGNMVSAASGSAVPVSRGPSRMQSAIGGMAAGAAQGAALGSAVPGVGSTIGAGVGAVAGLVAGLS